MAEILDPPTAVLDDRQQLFILNFAANAVGMATGTQDALESQFEKSLHRLLIASRWRVAWGPKVYKTDPNEASTPPTNAWYVATNGNKCVLAIAGTAPKSFSGWLQNFDVVKTVQWDKWVSKWPMEGKIPDYSRDQADDTISTIARGTADGVQNILSNQSTKAAPGAYVQDFLKKQPAGTEIYVVGHSMGGALAPTVALGLVQSKMITGNKVRVVASAGASPGNAKFAEQCNSRFDDGNFYNTKDVVPQAWKHNGGADRCFPNIYNVIFKNQKPSILKEITDITQTAGEGPSKSSGIKYSPMRGDSFTSNITIPIMNDLKTELGLVMRTQHGDAYLRELGIRRQILEFESNLHDSKDVGHLYPEPKDDDEDE